MIQNISGCAGALPIECVSPRKNKWKIRWNITEKEDGTAEWTEQDFDHKPTEAEIVSTIVGYYNKQVDEKILSGYWWHDMPVWLSTENQLNYKASYDLAVQTDGANLPVRVKFGTEEEPIYHDFTTLDEFEDFFKGAMYFIQQALMDGWEKKNSINISTYKLENDDD